MNCFEKLFGIKKPVDKPVEKTIENSSPIILPPSKVPWFDLALTHLGKKEGVDDEWIIDLFKHTTFGKAESSKVPWCAAFVCAMIEQSGFKSVRSASAHACSKIGLPGLPIEGAVMVWRHKYGTLANHYHVNFLIQRIDGKLFECIGGNQSNSVCKAIYSLDKYDLAAVRIPQKS